jgi:hypothetical protein
MTAAEETERFKSALALIDLRKLLIGLGERALPERASGSLVVPL